MNPAQINPLHTDSERNPEQRAACQPIERYFQGHARDDASCMRRAFLPSAQIESMREGVFTSWPLDTYCERFKGLPAADETTRRRTIDWIEVAGTAACARVTLVHGARNRKNPLQLAATG